MSKSTKSPGSIFDIIANEFASNLRKAAGLQSVIKTIMIL